MPVFGFADIDLLEIFGSVINLQVIHEKRFIYPN